MSLAVRIATTDDVAELTDIAVLSTWVRVLDWPRIPEDTARAYHRMHEDLALMVCDRNFIVLVLEEYPDLRGFAAARLTAIQPHCQPRAPECELLYLALEPGADVTIDGQALLDAVASRARSACASAIRCVVPNALPECRGLLVQNGWAETGVQYRYGLGVSGDEDDGCPVRLPGPPPVRTGDWAEEPPDDTNRRPDRW